MNKFDIKLGGHNLFREDVLFMQKQLSDAIQSFAQLSGNPFVIVMGVNPTIAGPNITWSDGWIWLNGEYCQVLAGSAPYPANDTFQIVETYDPDGQQTYEDLTVEDTYVYRRALIQGNAGGTNLFSNAVYFKSYLLLPISGWIGLTSLPGSSDWNFINGSSQFAGYRVNQINEVVLNGQCDNASYSSSTGATIQTLPNGPAKTQFFVCFGVVNSTKKPILVQVLNTGEIQPLGLTNGDNVTVYLDTIRFSLDWSGTF